MRQHYREHAFRHFKTTQYGHLNAQTESHYSALEREYAMLVSSHLPRDKDVSLLEIGCGFGVLLRWLHKNGYSGAEGIDVSSEQVAHCRDSGITNVQEADAAEFLREKPGQYEAIIAFDVFEHIPKEQVLEFLRLAQNALKPGGKLILRVPNMANLFAARSRYMEFTHEVGYTEHSMRQVLLLTNYKEIKVEPGEAPSRFRRRVRILMTAVLHGVLYRLAGVPRARVSSKNLLAVATAPTATGQE